MSILLSWYHNKIDNTLLVLSGSDNEYQISFASYQLFLFVTCYLGYTIMLYNRKAFTFTLPHVIMEEYYSSYEVGQWEFTVYNYKHSTNITFYWLYADSMLKKRRQYSESTSLTGFRGGFCDVMTLCCWTAWSLLYRIWSNNFFKPAGRKFLIEFVILLMAN